MIEEPTIKVRMSREFLEGSLWGLRTGAGAAITVEIGEPDEEGFYEPIFTATVDEWYRTHMDAVRVLEAVREIAYVLREPL